MVVDKNPYWMRKPSECVMERIFRIKEMLGDSIKTVRNITYKLYPDLHGKKLEAKYNLTIKDTVRGRTANFTKLSDAILFEQIRETRTTLRDVDGYKDVEDLKSAYTVVNLDQRYSRSKRESHIRPFEVWYEKETVEPEFVRVCSKFDVPSVDMRGQGQWSTEKKASDRLTKKHVILYFGDNDKKGQEIFEVIKRNMKAMGCEAEFIWCGLTNYQEEIYGLPHHARIDGLDLEDLKELVELEIMKYIDIDKYNKIVDQEQKDKEYLRGFKAIVVKK